MTSHLKDKDHGYKKWAAKQRRLGKDRPHVVVGWLQSAGTHIPRADDGKGGKKKAPKALSVATVAAFHEFGTVGGIPERSMMRAVVDGKRREIATFIEKAVKSTEDADHVPNVEQSLQLIGLKVQAMIKNRFTDNDWEPLKKPRPSGGTNPLNDTGQLKNSVNYEVRMGDEK